jgi:hypothetical protein
MINYGMLLVLLAILVGFLICYIEPVILLWLAGRCMARRSQILSGRTAFKDTWDSWGEKYNENR